MLVVDDEKESPLLSRREESARGWVAGDPRASTIIMPPLDPWKNANALPFPFLQGEGFSWTAEQSVVRRCTCDKWDGGGIRLLSKLIGSLTTIIRVEEGVEYLARNWNLLSFLFFLRERGMLKKIFASRIVTSILLYLIVNLISSEISIHIYTNLVSFLKLF